MIVIKPDIFSPLITARGKACKWKNKIIWTRWEAYYLIICYYFLLFWYFDTWLHFYLVTLSSPFEALSGKLSKYRIHDLSMYLLIHIQFDFLFLYGAFLHRIIIYCIYFCYIWRSCHLFTFSASRTAINTSGTRLKWDCSELLWSFACSSALYCKVLHFWYFSCIALPYCSESIHVIAKLCHKCFLTGEAHLQLNQLFCLQIRFVLKDSKCCDTVLQT